MSTLLEQIDSLITAPEALQAHTEWEQADAEWKSAVKSGAPDPEVLYLATALRVARAHKDDVFDTLARRAESLDGVDDVVEDYADTTLGDARQVADVPELSVAWHEMRRFGLGGSSLSEALGFHWKSMPGRLVRMDEHELDQHWVEMAVQKSTPVTEADEPSRGVLFRGHAWERALIARHALVHGVRVGVSKATWGGRMDFQRINTDGILLDEDGRPEGLLEVKTSSRQWTWNNGVPLHYRIQVLWYLYATGLDYADVIVKFDSGQVDTHRIHADETLDGTSWTRTVDTYVPVLTRRWRQLESRRDAPESLWRLSDRLRHEEDSIRSAFDPATGEVDLDLLDSTDIVKAYVASPYERMPDHEMIHRVDVEGGNGVVTTPVAGVSPVFYPIPVYPETHPLDPALPEGEVLCLDTPTYTHLCRRYGPDGLINMSALRRKMENLPGLSDFASISQCRTWINDLEEA